MHRPKVDRSQLVRDLEQKLKEHIFSFPFYFLNQLDNRKNLSADTSISNRCTEYDVQELLRKNYQENF